MKRLLVIVALSCAFAQAQTVQPLLQPHQTFPDGSGAPCTGCKLYSYAAGTTTPLATYTDSTGVTANTNPIVLDVAGGANIWIKSFSYKFVLKGTDGSTIWTVDNVNIAGGFLGYLPLSGGTLTGPLNAPSIAVSGTLINPQAGITLYVSATGSDANTGLSWASAMATIANAYAALPSCTLNHFRNNDGTYSSKTWTHCGSIELGPGVLVVPSQISIASPFVRIYGQSPMLTTLSYTGATGSAINWTANPFADEWIGSGGLYDLTIDGFGASAGTFGLTTNDISGMRISNAVIQNFSGVGSGCWNDIATSWYNEKFDVDLSLKNCTSGWIVNAGASSPGYPGTTFGYGRFNLKFDVFAGQQAITGIAGQVTFSDLNLNINQVQSKEAGAGCAATGLSTTAISGAANFALSYNKLMLHLEDPCYTVASGDHQISFATPSNFQNAGAAIQQDHPETNVGFTYPQAPLFYPTANTLSLTGTGWKNVLHINPCPLDGSVAGCEGGDIQAYSNSSYPFWQLPMVNGPLASAADTSTVANQVKNDQCFYALNATSVAQCIAYMNASSQLLIQGDSAAKLIEINPNPLANNLWLQEAVDTFFVPVSIPMIQASGTKFSVTGCGTATALVGGSLAGKFTAASASCTPVITTNQTAPNGYSCWMNDETTSAVKFQQTASTQTTATFTATGTLGGTDVINFGCVAF